MLILRKIAAYFELTKPRVNGLVLVTTAAGFFLAAQRPYPWLLFFHTLFGAGLVALGTCGLNECWEKDLDAKMRRTQGRPLPQERLTPVQAWFFSSFISAAGLFYLALRVNALSCLLTAATLAIYVFVYTPLKRKSSLCTLIGSVAGAIPPMIGWAAVRNDLSAGAWVLFAILFLWQLPTFLAVAWIYRDDYSRAGFPMLTVADRTGDATRSQILFNCAALLWVSVFPTIMGLTQGVYFVGAVVLGAAYFAASYYFSRRKPFLECQARRIFLASLLYLPALLLLMVLDKAWL